MPRLGGPSLAAFLRTRSCAFLFCPDEICCQQISKLLPGPLSLALFLILLRRSLWWLMLGKSGSGISSSPASLVLARTSKSEAPSLSLSLSFSLSINAIAAPVPVSRRRNFSSTPVPILSSPLLRHRNYCHHAAASWSAGQ